MKLKTKKIEGYEVDCYELDEFVQKLYDPDYLFVVQQEASNDSVYKFEADGKIDSWDEENAAKIRQGKICGWGNATLFNVLVADGHIPAGTYFVKVCW